jgi:hypothetical protein
MSQSESIKELATALAKAQSTIQPASKNATNPHFKSKYADLGAIWDACRKPLADNGLSIVQMPTDSGDGRVALITMLLHTSGEYINSTCSTRLQQDSAQGVGSALTYLRRYALAAMVGIVADEDDDGNAASQPQQQRQAPRPVDRPQLPAEQQNGVPKTAQDAEQRFYAKFSETVGGQEWSSVQRYLGSRAPRPTTIEGWIAAAEAVRDQTKAH